VVSCVPAAVIAGAVAVLLIPGQSPPGGWWPGLAVLVIAVGAPAVLAARQQRLPRSGRGRAAGGCSRPGQTGLNQPSLGYGALGYGRRGRRRFRARVRLVVEVVAVLAAVGGIVMFRQQSTQPGAAVDFYTSAAPALVAIPVVIVVLRVYPWCCEACCAAPSADGVRPGSSAWSGPHGPRSPPRCRRSRWCSRSPWPPSPAWSGTR
jgi:hypothetical protein